MICVDCYGFGIISKLFSPNEDTPTVLRVEKMRCLHCGGRGVLDGRPKG